MHLAPCQQINEASSSGPKTTDSEEILVLCSNELAATDDNSMVNNEKCDNTLALSASSNEDSSVACFEMNASSTLGDTVGVTDGENSQSSDMKYEDCDNFESDINSNFAEESTDVPAEIKVSAISKDTFRLSEEKDLNVAPETTEEASLITDMKELKNELLDLSSYLGCKARKGHIDTAETAEQCEDCSETMTQVDGVTDVGANDETCDIAQNIISGIIEETFKAVISSKHSTVNADTNIENPDEAVDEITDTFIKNEKDEVAQNIIEGHIDTATEKAAISKQSTASLLANSVYPDEIAPVGAVSSGCSLIDQQSRDGGMLIDQHSHDGCILIDKQSHDGCTLNDQECHDGATLIEERTDVKKELEDLTADIWIDGFGIRGLFSQKCDFKDLTTECKDDLGLRSLFSEKKKKTEKSKSARKRKKQQQKLLKVDTAKQGSNKQASRFAQSSEELVFGHDDDVDSGLTCPVCLELFHQPCACHPCGHIFCDPCLRRLTTLRGGWEEVPCPLCRTVIQTCELQQEFNHILRGTHPDIYASRAAAERRSRFRHHKLPSTPSVPLGRRLIRHLRTNARNRQPDAGWMSHDWFKFLLGCTVGVCTSMLIMLLNRVRSINDVRDVNIMFLSLILGASLTVAVFKLFKI